MKALVSSCMALGLFFSTSAIAADMASPAAYDWSGFYASGLVGFGDSGAKWVYDAPPARGTSVRGDNDVVFGGALGYQRQFSDQFVVGFEGGVLANLPGGDGDCFNPAFTCKIDKTTALYIGPKLGYTVDRFMLSVMGGYAGAKIKDFEINKATGAVGFPSSKWHDGWFLGAGADYAFTDNVIFGVNYKHIDLGRDNHAPSPFAATETRDITLTEDVVAASVTFKFNP
jgi:outer membrane immunogenic protein